MQMYKSIIKQDTGDYIVAKSNKLVQQSKINLSICEQRIVNYMISKIMANDKEFTFIEFDYNDFCRLCNIKSTNFSYIRQLVKNFYDKSWQVYDGTHYVPVKWIDDYKINTNEILLKFHHRMEEFLLNLKERGNYTQTELLTYLNFKNRYSPILYDYCRSFVNLTFKNKEKTIERVLTLTELRDKLGLNETENKNKYPYFKDFRVRVLEPCVNEINKYTDINIEYEPIKKSRKVDSIKLTIQIRGILERMQMYEERRKHLNEPGE